MADGQPDGADDDPADAASLKCCCGRTDCVFLKHSSSVLESVERDVHNAARMGQVCLSPARAGMHLSLSPRRARRLPP